MCVSCVSVLVMLLCLSPSSYLSNSLLHRSTQYGPKQTWYDPFHDWRGKTNQSVHASRSSTRNFFVPSFSKGERYTLLYFCFLSCCSGCGYVCVTLLTRYLTLGTCFTSFSAGTHSDSEVMALVRQWKNSGMHQVDTDSKKL